MANNGSSVPVLQSMEGRLQHPVRLPGYIEYVISRNLPDYRRKQHSDQPNQRWVPVARSEGEQSLPSSDASIAKQQGKPSGIPRISLDAESIWSPYGNLWSGRERLRCELCGAISTGTNVPTKLVRRGP